MALLLAVFAVPLAAQTRPPCAQHARDCPAPAVVEPGPASAPPLLPPRDAVVLFGADLAAWRNVRGGAAPWKVGDGYFEIAPGTGGIETVRGFGDVQVHIEWSAPAPPQGRDQDRGNSGVFLMGKYEVQILDSYGNPTYPDGSAGAVYGQYPPMVNASRAPGEWQSYDIIFRRPRFGPSGELLEPAFLTVTHNGVLVQDHVALTGPTGHQRRPPYEAHPDRLPLSLQDHGHRVRFRNVWVRELER
ncbi:MAG: 3-keto-disaccharide hydrolase [Gemmatimonadales bacterium]